MNTFRRVIAITWTLIGGGIAQANASDSADVSAHEPTTCIAAAQKSYKKDIGLAALHQNQGMRACYDIIDLGHPVPGSVCIKRVESNYARDLQSAETTLNQALSACQESSI